MLKLFKWDFLIYFKKYFWAYILYAILLIVSSFYPVYYDNIFPLLVSALGVVLFFIGLLVPIFFQIAFLNEDTAILENCFYIKEWKIAFQKLMFSLIIQTINILLIFVLVLVLRRFATETSSYLSFNFNENTNITDLVSIYVCLLCLSTVTVLAELIIKAFIYVNNSIVTFLVMLIIDAFVFYIGINVFKLKNNGFYIFLFIVSIVFFFINVYLLKKKVDIL